MLAVLKANAFGPDAGTIGDTGLLVMPVQLALAAVASYRSCLIAKAPLSQTCTRHLRIRMPHCGPHHELSQEIDPLLRIVSPAPPRDV